MLATLPQILDCAVPYATAPRCGVYILIRHGAAAHVGYSADVGLRLQQHARAGRKFDSVFVHDCPADNLASLSRGYADALQILPRARADARPVTTPDGEFAGVAQASAAAGITRQTGYGRIGLPGSGWRFTHGETPAKPARAVRSKEVRESKAETAHMRRFVESMPPRAVTTPSGEFASVAAASLALGIGPSAVLYNLKTGADGWRFIGPESRELVEAERARFRESITCA